MKAIAIVLVVTGTAYGAMDVDAAAKSLRDGRREQRTLQAEAREAAREVRGTAVITHTPSQQTVEEYVHTAAPVEIRSREDALKYLASPEMTAQLSDAVKQFNSALPKLNAEMASHPVSGMELAPLEPLTDKQLQSAIIGAMDNGGALNVPQFDAMKGWVDEMLRQMTNGVTGAKAKPTGDVR
jgi:hypothetical protein